MVRDLNLLLPKEITSPTMIDLRGISTNWFKNQLYLSTRLSRLRAQRRYDMNRGGTT
jgi:hypothetical protein